MRIPRPVRTGAAESAIERVEPNVSREEIFAAVQAQMSRETLLFVAGPLAAGKSEPQHLLCALRFDGA